MSEDKTNTGRSLHEYYAVVALFAGAGERKRKRMRVAGSMPKGRVQVRYRGGYGGGIQRRYRPRYGPQSEAVFILVLFLLLVVILLYFS